MELDHTATIQSLTALEASIRRRSETDTRFLSWWVYFLVLSWLTLGIAGIYYFIKRISRIDNYSARKQEYYSALADFTDRYSQAMLRDADAGGLVRDLRSATERAKNYGVRPIGALKAFLLTIITFGIYGIVAWYQVNRAWADRQGAEADVDVALSAVWIKLGITSYPITFERVEGKERNFGLYFILTIITFGIWGLVWDYRVHTDPDTIYPRIHLVEDTVLQLARAA